MTVRIFRNTDYGAPQLYGAIGSMIPVLDAFLRTGYGQLSITSLTHSNGIVTAVTASPHGLSKYGRQVIAGANEAGYNGEFVITPTGDSEFTYQAAGIVVNIATGTITTKTPGSGWTKPFTGTNLAAFRQGAGNMRYLRIDDTTTGSCRAVAYENMTGISAGTGDFPTAGQFPGGLYFQKSSTTDGTNARPWIAIANDKTFYLWVGYNSTFPYDACPIVGFGDLPSRKVGDAFNTFLLANISTAVTGFRFSYLNTSVLAASTGGMYLARSHTQIGSSVEASRTSDSSRSALATNMGTNGLSYPHQPDGGYYMAPVSIIEAVTGIPNSIRGEMPGVWNPLHPRSLAHGDTFQGSGSLDGKTFIALNCQLSAQVAFEISDTWDL